VPHTLRLQPASGYDCAGPDDLIEENANVHPVPLYVLTLPDKKPALEPP